MSKRPYGEGSIDQRGKDLWRLRYRVNGKQFTDYVHGTVTEARRELRRRLKAGDDGAHVAPDKITVAKWIEEWLAGLQVGARTAERYAQLMRIHVIPHLGEFRLQRLTANDVKACYKKLTGKISPRTRRHISPRTRHHVHVVLGTCLREAVRTELLSRNPLDNARAPTVPDEEEVEALGSDKLARLLAGFEGHPLYVFVATAIATGARRNELVALRWADVDFEQRTVRIARTVEATKAHGKRLKPPKTRRGTRTITIDAGLVALLRTERERHLRVMAGIPDGAEADLSLVRLPDEALLFPAPGGDLCRLRDDHAITRGFVRRATALGFPRLRLHDLRHTHGSRLIKAGLPITAVAARLGHSPAVLLSIYAHDIKDAEGVRLAADIVASLAVLKP